jgi:NAD(P)-dependent dehydrogenase (short-subunit alcohol dehydrogenase family)
MAYGIEVLHKSDNARPKISLILLDWSCRESFHIFHYLRRQSAPRADFEVIWVEFYGRRPEEIAAVAAEPAPGILDQWVVMNVGEQSYYHKHAAYNVGIAAARGEIVCIMDSDAFMGPDFIANVIKAFDEDPDMALHVDEVRNVERRHYPFDYPPVEEVLAGECINWTGTTTTGLADQKTPLYTRNYGACLFARRDAVIAIGGADEHLDYMGHVCGPYDLTFRLVNAGKREVWHPTEFIYHCWHPGTDGDNNFIGPHDGRNNSTRALNARDTGRQLPFLENPAIQKLREAEGTPPSFEDLAPLLLTEQRTQSWRFSQEKQLLSRCRQAYYASRWEEAVQIFESMEEKPEQADFLAEMARALFISGRQDAASPLLRKVIELDPANRIAANTIGWSLRNAGLHQKALHWFDAALDQVSFPEPGIHSEVLRGRAWTLLALGLHKEAAQAFRSAIEATPSSSTAIVEELRRGYAQATARIPLAALGFSSLRRVKRLAKKLLGRTPATPFDLEAMGGGTSVMQDASPDIWWQHRFGLSQARWGSLAGKAFWVTGAGTGYGRCIAVSLALAGAKVFLSGRREEKLRESILEAQRLAKEPVDMIALPVDVTDESAVRRAAAGVDAASPAGLHGLVHCAALPQTPRAYPLLKMTLSEWDAMQRTNVTAGWLLTREAAGSLVRGGAPRVLFLGSEAGWADTLGHGPYNISKAALNSLAAALAAEFADSHPEVGPQVNLLVPGEARTEMNQGSTVSPYSVVSMTLLLLSCPPGGPNGKLFHRDGRALSFAYNRAFAGSLLDG